MQSTTATSPVRLRGVNLGGWLVLEKWMTPSLFEGLEATDETTWCAELGREAAARLRAHWNHFITREDFAWLASVGVNAVRLPIGHWVLGPPYPYHSKYGAARHPFVDGGIDVVDRALEWASEFGLRVLLDLHAAPGCQNGFDNGGIKDVCEWHTREEYLAHSVDLLGRLAARYRAAPGPARHRGAERAALGRAHAGAQGLLRGEPMRRSAPTASRGRVAVVFHDGFRKHGEFAKFFRRTRPRERAVRRAPLPVLRTRRPRHGHPRPPRQGRRAVARRGRLHPARLEVPAIAGEWSLGLDLKVVSLWAEGPYNHALQPLDPSRRASRCAPTARPNCSRSSLPRLVLLELPHRDDARVVLPRLRRAGLAAAALSVTAAPARRTTSVRWCSGLEPGVEADGDEGRIRQRLLQHLQHQPLPVGRRRRRWLPP
jgi:glucan 1,3-beta-glucosidase